MNSLLTLSLLVLAAPVFSAQLEATVHSDKNEPLKDAVVYAVPHDRSVLSGILPKTVNIDQRDKEFIPAVTAIYAGDRVNFPNDDKIRHHVYSFSKAKQFEIPLYKGMPARPVTFETAGDVALGCNIHDWMNAHVFVSETPFFAVSNEQGEARIDDLPPGTYTLMVWHPSQLGDPGQTARELALPLSRQAPVDFVVKLRKLWTAFRAPSSGAGSYR